MYGDWLAAPLRSDFISIKTTYSHSSLKIRQFNVLLKDFEKLLLIKK